MPCCMKLFALVTMLTFILPRTTQSSSNYTWSTADGCASRSARTTVTCANCSVHSSIDKDSLMTTFLTGICSSSVRIIGKWLSYIWPSHFWRVFSALFIRHSDHSAFHDINYGSWRKRKRQIKPNIHRTSKEKNGTL